MSDSSVPWDVVIVGAGAAGLYAAIHIADHGLRCLIVERKPKTGAKILMSGGTRCNVTNQNPTVRDYATNHPRILDSILKQHRSDEVIRFFSSIGVDFDLEDDGRMYPSTHQAKSVLNALLSACQNKGVRIMNGICIDKIKSDNEIFVLTGSDQIFKSRAVVMSSGGLSFPTTGSDGVGLNIVKELGHSLVETTPSLVPLLTKESLLYRDLAGISCMVKLSCRSHSKVFKHFTGSLLFTHKGISGPVVLNISRFWLREKSSSKSFEIDFVPAHDEAALKDFFIQSTASKGASYVRTMAESFVPKKIALFLMSACKLSADLKLSSLSKQQRNRLVQELKHHQYPVVSSEGYSKAEVTAGGVALTQINHTTMESRIIPKLFIIGEMLDGDGRIGGFNFHWAWATAATAAKGVVQCLKQS